MCQIWYGRAHRVAVIGALREKMTRSGRVGGVEAGREGVGRGGVG